MNLTAQLSVLVPYMMQQHKNLTVHQAIQWVLGWPPKYRRSLALRLGKNR